MLHLNQLPQKSVRTSFVTFPEIILGHTFPKIDGDICMRLFFLVFERICVNKRAVLGKPE